MTSHPSIVVVGSINMDLTIRTEHLPVAGETVLGTEYLTAPGGKGANQAIAAAKLGAEVRMIGAVGEDAFGDVLIANLNEWGVQTASILRKSGANSGVAMINTEKSGENTIIVAGGANRQLTREDILAQQDAIKTADVLICQLEIPVECVQTALEIARANGVMTVLNAAPVCPLSNGLLRLVDYLVVNETEAMQLGEAAIGELEDVEQVSGIFLHKGVKGVVLTMGAKGANLVNAEHRIYVPTFPVKAVDTVGAGDAFVGAFSVGLARQNPLEEILKYSNAVGALATIRPGAQNGMPTEAEVGAFLALFQRKDFV